jgi:AAA domain
MSRAEDGGGGPDDARETASHEGNSEDHESRARCSSVTGRICLADVVPEQVTWLWPGRIPVGKIVTLDGDPGLGKSAIALTMAAIVSRGDQWPDGTRCDETGDVLIMTAEDGVADTVRPRLDAAHADPRRVHVIDHVLDNCGEPIPVTLAATDQIERHITETGARLLIIDVLMAYMPGDAHKDQDVRKALTPFAKMAERTGCTMLLLRHLKRNTGGEPVYLGGGSIGIVGAARAGFMVTRDPDRPNDVRILASVKSNLASAPKSMEYRLVGADNGSVAVEWIGEDQRTAAELLMEPSDNLGETSRRIEEFVNSRSETTSGDVTEEFDIAPKLANQYLNRLKARRSICQKRRGVFGPKNSSSNHAEGSEDAEDSEDGEDYADQSATADLHPCASANGDQAYPHDPHSSVASEADASVCTVGTCPECGLPLGLATGKCVPCIVKHQQAQGAQHPTTGSHQLVESGGWAITEPQIGAAVP